MNNLSELKNVFADILEEKEKYDENGNFFFVKKYDDNLYISLIKMESMLKLNIKKCAVNIRDALTIFLKNAFENHDYLISLAKEEAIKNLKNPSDNYDITPFAYIEVAKSNYDKLHINTDKASKIRIVGNIGHHWEEGKNLKYSEIKETVQSFQELLIEYYSFHNPEDANKLAKIKYNVDYAPIDDKIVYQVEPREYGNCKAQYLCYRQLANKNEYYVIRQYDSSSFKNFKQRDEEVLNKLWNESIRNPQNIVKYERIEEEVENSNQKNKHIFICYKLNGKPTILTPQIISNWSIEEKIEIMRMLADAVESIHRNKIYHRNIRPNSVYVYEVNGQYGINLVNFEFSKIVGGNVTVAGKALENYNNTNLFYAPEFRGDGIDLTNINWEKADIYSLGKFFIYILSNGDLNSGTIGNVNVFLKKYPKDYPNELKELIKQMCATTADNRPNINEVKRVLNNINI